MAAVKTIRSTSFEDVDRPIRDREHAFASYRRLTGSSTIRTFTNTNANDAVSGMANSN